MACRHGGGNKDKVQRDCRACLQDVIRNLRFDNQNLKERLDAVTDRAAVERVAVEHQDMRRALNWIHTLLGYTIRNPKTPDFIRHLEEKRRDLETLMRGIRQ